MGKYLDYDGLSYFWQKVKDYIDDSGGGGGSVDSITYETIDDIVDGTYTPTSSSY